jgi:uncharacterized protein YjbJ (UPF0337 family)
LTRARIVRPRAGRNRGTRTFDEEDDMGNDDKLQNQGESAYGKAKEKVGDLTDDKDLQASGKKDQSKADLKQAGEKVKDAFKK